MDELVVRRLARRFGISDKDLDRDRLTAPVRRNLLALCRQLAPVACEVLQALPDEGRADRERLLTAMFAATVEQAESVGLVVFTPEGNDTGEWDER